MWNYIEYQEDSLRKINEQIKNHYYLSRIKFNEWSLVRENIFVCGGLNYDGTIKFTITFYSYPLEHTLYLDVRLFNRETCLDKALVSSKELNISSLFDKAIKQIKESNEKISERLEYQSKIIDEMKNNK